MNALNSLNQLVKSLWGAGWGRARIITVSVPVVAASILGLFVAFSDPSGADTPVSSGTASRTSAMSPPDADDTAEPAPSSTPTESDPPHPEDLPTTAAELIEVDEEAAEPVDDEMAMTTLCTIDADVIAAMPHLPGESETSAEGLRMALTALTEQHDEWTFVAYGRPGFLELLSEIETIEEFWQTALTAFDNGDDETAETALSSADQAIATVRERLETANVSCPSAP